MEADERARRHIALIGLPGVGKSTVGLLVARLICRPFFDSDTALGLAPTHRVARDATLDAAERAWFERVAASRQPGVIAAPTALLTTGVDDTVSNALWIVWLDVSTSVLDSRIGSESLVCPTDSMSARVASSPELEPVRRLREQQTSMARELCDLRLDVDDIDGAEAARAIVAGWRGSKPVTAGTYGA